MSFLLRILRITMPMLEYIALLKPGQLKESSFIAESEQPATIGTKLSQTYPAWCSIVMSGMHIAHDDMHSLQT